MPKYASVFTFDRKYFVHLNSTLFKRKYFCFRKVLRMRECNVYDTNMWVYTRQ